MAKIDVFMMHRRNDGKSRVFVVVVVVVVLFCFCFCFCFLGEFLHSGIFSPKPCLYNRSVHLPFLKL